MLKKLLNKTIVLGLLSCSLAQADTMLGSYIKGNGWLPSEIDSWNSVTKKQIVILNIYSNFDYDWDHLKIQSDNIVVRGAVPLISWMPVTHTRPKANILREIAQGKWDPYIDKWIQGFKEWRASTPKDQPSTIMLRFGHEFNGNWFPWGNDPKNYIAAWRYLYNKFKVAGINPYIDWVWSANNIDVDRVKNITKYYPGNQYVDWTSLDGYNWGTNYTWSSWKTFDETFSAMYVKLVTNYPTKPIILAEVGVAEPSDLPNPVYGQNGNNMDKIQSKEAWIADMFSRVATAYPAIRAINWFNINKELSWALSDGKKNTGASAYKTMAQNTHFVSKFQRITGKPVKYKP